MRRYAIGDDGRIASVTDADGVVEVANVYDDEGRVLEQRSPFGRTHAVRLPAGPRDGRRATTRTGRRTRSSTTTRGGCWRSSTATTSACRCNYDRWGNPVAITERGGAVTVQEWDERARLVRRVLPTGATLTYAYDDADRVVEIAASTGAVTRMRYDGDERIPVEIDRSRGRRHRVHGRRTAS